MSKHKLRILHISDLHERVALPHMKEDRKTKVEVMSATRHRVLGSPISRALDQIKNDGRVDIICFTGDVADWGIAEEYPKATVRIEKLLATLNVSHKRLFVIPGNHDVKRSENTKQAWRGMRKLVRDEHIRLGSWMAGLEAPPRVKKDWRNQILARTSNFWQWVIRDLKRDELSPELNQHKRLGYSTRLKIDHLPFPVHIVGLDSAWLAGDNYDKGNLLITAQQIDMLTREFDESGLAKGYLAGFRIALVHHPLSDLADAADSKRRLADSVDILLHGHQHDPIAELFTDPDRRLPIVAAGSLYEGDEGDRWVNSFNVIDVILNDEGRPEKYDLEFWAWSTNGHWHRSGAFYRSAPLGKLSLLVGSFPAASPVSRTNVPSADTGREGLSGASKVATTSFLDSFGPDPVSLKLAVRGCMQGNTTIAITWPKDSDAMLKAADNLIKHAKQYRKKSSIFYGATAESVAYFMEHTDPDRVRKSRQMIERRIPFMLQSIKVHWDYIPWNETTLSNYLRLANFRIHKDDVAYTLSHESVYDRFMPKSWKQSGFYNTLREGNDIRKLFSIDDPLCSAHVYQYAGKAWNANYWGPCPLVRPLYSRHIDTGWCREFLVPQIEIELALKASQEVLSYDDKVKISKVSPYRA